MDAGGSYVIYSPVAGASAGAVAIRAGGAFSVSTNNSAVITPALRVDTAGRLLVNPDGSGTSFAVSLDPGTTTAPLVRDSLGRLLVGASTARTNVNGYQPLLQVETAGSTDAFNRYASFTYGRNSGGGGFVLAFNRHASTTVGGQATVADTYVLGQLDFNGSDGTNFISGARIQAQVDGTPAAGVMPAWLTFSVTPEGKGTPEEAMRIKKTKIINFANAPVYADNATAKAGGLVAGDVYRTATGQLMIAF